MPFEKDDAAKAVVKSGGSSFQKKSLRNSVFTGVALKEGYMSKQSTGLFKRWQTRWFSLKGHYLSYYQDESKAGDIKGAVDIAQLEHVKLMDEAGAWEIKNKGQVTKMKCETKESANVWVEAIKEAAASVEMASKNDDGKMASPTSAASLEHQAFKQPKLLHKQAQRIDGSHYLLQVFTDADNSSDSTAKLQVRGMKVATPSVLLQWDFSESELQSKFGEPTPWEGPGAAAFFADSRLLADLKEAQGHSSP